MKKDAMIHCSATPGDQELTPEELGDMHAKRGIRRPGGYHRYVRRDGSIIKLRPFEQGGAHAYGYNRTHIGVCYEGGIVAGGDPNNPAHAFDTRTNAQKRGIEACLQEVAEWNAKRGYRSVKVIGHRDVSEDIDGDGVIEPWEWMKQCPCYDATEHQNFLTMATSLLWYPEK